MDKGATHTLVSRSDTMQPPQTYLADANGKRLAWIEQNALDASHPYAPYLDSHKLPTFGSITGPRLVEALLPDAHAEAGAGEALPRVLVRLWRPARAAGYGRMVQVAAAARSTRRSGLDRISRSTIAAPTDRGMNSRVRSIATWAMPRSRISSPASTGSGASRSSMRARSPIMGWSYGGYMTLKLLEKAPGVFAAGAAVAPVTKWELYDTAYTERYLGNPSVDPKPYQTSDALDDAVKITRPIAARSRHVRRQCRVPEFDRALRSASARRSVRSR